MKKSMIILLCLILIFIAGCSSVRTDDKLRISGIIDACKAYPQLRQQYLKQKVERKEISQLTSYTIQECLK